MGDKGRHTGASLDFHVEDIEVEPFGAEPTLNFRLRIGSDNGLPIRCIMLQTQIRIEAGRRYYDDTEKEKLTDLFGHPESSSHTIRGLFWTQVGTVVPPFQGECPVTLPVPASYDFNLAVTKFFYALEKGIIPLLLLFSGSVAYQDETGALQFDQIPWSKEAVYQLPLDIWAEMIRRYHPHEVWLGLSRENFDRLYRYKRQNGLPSVNAALERLLDGEGRPLETDLKPGANA